MFYYFSKLAWTLITPSTALVLLALVGLIGWHLLNWRWGTRLALVATSLLLVAGVSPLGNLMLLTLEERFPPVGSLPPKISGVIVLGGVIDEDATYRRGQLATNEAAERIFAFADLAARLPDARLVVTGGTSAFTNAPRPEGDLIADASVALGTSRDRILVENRSRTTDENARFTKALVQPRPDERWLLVTSAFHMTRAVGSFRKAGFDVIAYPVDFRTAGPGDRFNPFADVGSGLRRVDLVAKEWVGLVAYWLAGKTSELAPRA